MPPFGHPQAQARGVGIVLLSSFVTCEGARVPLALLPTSSPYHLSLFLFRTEGEDEIDPSTPYACCPGTFFGRVGAHYGRLWGGPNLRSPLTATLTLTSTDLRD